MEVTIKIQFNINGKFYAMGHLCSNFKFYQFFVF